MAFMLEFFSILSHNGFINKSKGEIEMKKFAKGFLAGSATVIATAAGALLAINKTVVEPVKEKQKRIDDNRKKAMRKSRARS